MAVDSLGEDMIKKISRCSRLHSALGVVKKTRLIQCVRVRPCLWDHKCSDFKFASARQNAFLEIVKEMSDEQHEYTRSQMQEEWGKIRYCFTRIMKKVISTNDDADAISWPHWEDMQFMYDQIKENLLKNGDYGESEHTRKRRKTRASVYFKRLRSGDNAPREAQRADEAADGGISTAAATALYHLGATGEQRPAATSVKIKSEEFERGASSIADEDIYEEHSAGSDGSASVSPAAFGQSVAAVQPSSSASNVATLSDALLAGGQEYRYNSNLPSVESADGAPKTHADGDKDPNDFFGTYMIQQMKSVSRRNPTLGVLLRKELMEVCCKYELQIFS